VLNFLRKNAAESKLIKVFLGMIVLVFVFFGVGVFGSQVEWAAKVNDEVVSKVAYDRAYTNLDRAYRNSLPQGQSPELIRSQALEQLVNTEVLVQEARRLGLQVGEDELRESIAAIPEFQVDGRVNKNRYLEVLRAIRMKPADFEETQQRQLLADKVLTLIRAGIHVTDEEVRERFHYEHDRVTLRFLRVRHDDYLNSVSFEETDLQSYYDQEKESFREPERVRIEYVPFRAESFAQEVTPSDEDVQVYYEEHQAEFNKPEEVRARHILFKIAPGSSEDEKKAVRERAAAVLQRARGGEDFAQLARDNSEDSTAAAGGDLGAFRRGAMTKPFEDAAFGLEAGAISDLVETEFGLHIIKVEEKTAAGVRSLDEVRPEIVAAIQKRESRRLALKRVEDAYDKIIDGASLADTAAAIGGKVETTPPFARGEVIPQLGRRPEINDAAFALDSGETSEIMNLDDGYLIFQVSERKESYIPELAAIRDKVEQMLRAKRAGEAAHAYAEEALAALRGGKDLETVAADFALTSEDTGEIGRFGGYIPKLGNAPELKEEAFRLTPEKPLPERVFDVGNETIVARLGEKVAAGAEQFEKDKPTLSEVIRQEREQIAIKAFLDQLRARAEIRIASGYGDLS
jgi:peptidyl-prolyl cis-trans isomerase D